MKKLSFFLFLIIYINTFAQNYQVKGKVVNGSVNSPIAFVNVTLVKNDSVYNGAVTDSLGVFLMSAPKGQYKLRLQRFGETLLDKKVDISQNLDLGTLAVKQSVAIKEVVIKKNKPLIQQKVDQLVFNVENSVTAAGGNALDALKITPKMQMQNNQISMIGKGGVAVMINDRIVYMSGEELANYLKSLSAENIKSIEVITNPPAKYSTEGNSGLVNIVLKKNKIRRVE